MTFLGSINDAAAVFDATCDADMIENSHDGHLVHFRRGKRLNLTTTACHESTAAMYE